MIILTEDDPRDEDPAVIADQIEEGIENCNHVFIEDQLPLRLDSEKVINVLKDNPPSFTKPLVDYKHFTRNFKYYFENVRKEYRSIYAKYL